MPGRETDTPPFDSILIAPCGMNCGLCYAYVREKNVCPGCRGEDRTKPKYCVVCRIKTCEKMAREGREFCFGCDTFPCARLKQLDKRYRTKYGMSMIENLGLIETFGMDHFLRIETERRTCPECGGVICVHKAECPSCGREWR